MGAAKGMSYREECITARAGVVVNLEADEGKNLRCQAKTGGTCQAESILLCILLLIIY